MIIGAFKLNCISNISEHLVDAIHQNLIVGIVIAANHQRLSFTGIKVCQNFFQFLNNFLWRSWYFNGGYASLACQLVINISQNFAIVGSFSPDSFIGIGAGKRHAGLNLVMPVQVSIAVK